MPRLRRLAGAEVVRVLGQFGFAVHSQRGSHIKLRRVLSDGTLRRAVYLATPGRLAPRRTVLS